eukprot:SAG31_NODE_1342_length_8700_cov_12.667829_6_plen_43_part_00
MCIGPSEADHNVLLQLIIILKGSQAKSDVETRFVCMSKIRAL